MNPDSMNIGDLKKMRLNRHWSQEQLAAMSGLSIRTIQRIENGENAGLESLKSLAAVFETHIVDPDKKEKMEQTQKEEAYIKSVKGFYGLLVAVVLIMAVPFMYVINDPSNLGLFVMFLLPCLLAIGIYGHQVFDWFGENWKRRLIRKKFKNKQSLQEEPQ